MFARLVRNRGARRGVTIALVGREEIGDENLSLRYLAAAVRAAGHHPVIVPLSGPDSLPDAEKQIRAIRPAVVGLSMPDSDITIDALAFIRYLRDKGYDGHITCGGPLATLVRGELLDRHPGLDSVIRHDGEVPLTELLDCIGSNRPVAGIAGMTTRSGDGLPALVTDKTSLATRPMHADPLPRLLGVPTARLSTSRGCPGRCPYCGPAALQREAIREGRAQGLGRAELSEAGVGRTRYRHFTDVADEIADLHHGSGARFFQIIDENLLSGEESRARAWLEGLLGELREHRVGKLAFCLQADPDTLTPPILDLLEELGVIRVSMGIEGLTTPQRRALGRTGEAAPHVAVLEELRRRGFVASFNSIIVHPQSTAAGIARELEALEALPVVHFDVLSMAVYPGTQMHQRLLRDGRVTGGMFALRFEPHDVVVKRFRAALIRLRLEAIGRYGANIFAHDVAVNLALARRLGLPGYSPALESTLFHALADQNAVRLRVLRKTLALAESPLEGRERELAMASIVRDLSRELVPTVERLESIQRALEGAIETPGASPNLMIGSSIAAGFVLNLVAATACGGTTVDSLGRSSSDAGSHHPARVAEAGVARPESGAIRVDPTPECTSSERADVFQRFEANGCHTCEPPQTVPYGVAIDANGNVVDVLARDGGPVPDDIRRCYLAALAGAKFPCLSGEDVWYECVTILR